jgi:hypothetical protein
MGGGDGKPIYIFYDTVSPEIELEFHIAGQSCSLFLHGSVNFLHSEKI